MQVTGKITKILPEYNGTTKQGTPFRKVEFVLETFDRYPATICFEMTNERIDRFPVRAGMVVCVYFDLNSREYQGRYYTTAVAWRVSEPNQGEDMPS